MLGSKYIKEATEFIIWSPSVNNVKLLIYKKDSIETLDMKNGDKGQWSLILGGDYRNIFYNYLVKIQGFENIVVDHYEKAVGVNGEKSMVVDLEFTNLNGWNLDKKPDLLCVTDSILYEIHVRYFSIDKNSGVDESEKGKDFNEDLVVAFKIKDEEETLVIYNANNKEIEIKIEEGF